MIHFYNTYTINTMWHMVGCVLAGCGLGALGAGFGLWQYRRKDIA